MSVSRFLASGEKRKMLNVDDSADAADAPGAAFMIVLQMNFIINNTIICCMN